VQLAISDDHLGLKAALAATLPGASWPRCRVHFRRNLLTQVPESTQTIVATVVRSILPSRMRLRCSPSTSGCGAALPPIPPGRCHAGGGQ
jgi:transposase-like protein